MASISSLSGSSSSSSIYGNRNMNIISGLASGLDTESMIEGLVQSYQEKINGLKQDKTKVEWTQLAYQGISNKLVEFSQKYMDLTKSETNLSSASFFTNAVKTTASGENANLVSVSGSSSSTIAINAVKQLAEKAQMTSQKLTVKDTDDAQATTSTKLSELELTGMDGTYSFKINEKDISVDGDATLGSLISAINNSDAGVTASFSTLTGKLVLTSNETGEDAKIKVEGDLAKAIFGENNAAEGKDAVVGINVNGENIVKTFSSNTFDLDGISVTVEGTFNEDIINEQGNGYVDDGLTGVRKVNITTKTDTESIISVVKDMVTQYNDLLKSVRDAYATQPLKDSNGQKYEPLTDDEKADLSDDEIAKYEEKGKTGLLYMDSDISSLYNDLRSAFSSMSVELEQIGIEVGYDMNNHLTTLTVDEDKLEEALLKDPTQVQEIFTRENKDDPTKNGLMARIEDVTDKYAATTGATKGILIEKAGSVYAPTSALKNTMLEKMNDIQEEIEKWQDKLSNKVDFYTKQFTQLELLINDMNSQSSALAGFMGGY